MAEQTDPGVEPAIARPGGVSYLRIPSVNVAGSAAFYRDAFGWELRGDPSAPSFADGTGHVIGRWSTDLPAVGEAGVIPYIYVADLDDALLKVAEHGGKIVTTPYPEGSLWIATINDPAGNVIGIWQDGPRPT